MGNIKIAVKKFINNMLLSFYQLNTKGKKNKNKKLFLYINKRYYTLKIVLPRHEHTSHNPHLAKTDSLMEVTFP